MLNKIIAFSVKQKLIIGIFTLGLILYGALELKNLPIDAVPDITNNQVQIITQAPAYGATDIERLVTFPIELSTSNIPGLVETRSFSRFGLSLVTLVFEDDVDVYWVRQQVTERLLAIKSQIPPSIGEPELGPVATGLGEIYQYVVRPKKGFEHKYSLSELRTIQDWYVRPQLMHVRGVAEISSFGGKVKQYEVQVNPKLLQATRVTLEEVFQALQSNNENTGGAYIEKDNTALFIRTEGLVSSMDEIKMLLIKRDHGKPIFIKDIGEVREGHATRYGALTYNDQGEVAGGIVMMLKGANSNVVIESVKEKIAEVQKSLPEGVMVEAFLDRTKMVNNAIKTVETNLAEGALIVLFILVVFLGNLRAGLLVASVIPLSMLFAVIMMNLFGVSGNLMSLGALDFGLIIDGAVIIVEAVLHQVHVRSKLRNDQNQAFDTTVAQAAGKMMNSAVFGQLIILIVYLPLFSLGGVEGKMFIPMAQTVIFALLGAFILSLTYVPMMSALVLNKKHDHGPTWSDRMMDALSNKFEHILKFFFKYSSRTIVAVLIAFSASIWIFSGLGGEFIPSLEEGDFAVDTRVLTGSNLNTTIEYTQKANKVLLEKFPEIEKIATKIGSGEVPTDPMPMEASDMMIIMKPKEEWVQAKTFDEMSEKMGEALRVIPGLSTGFQYPVQMRFNELLTGARQDVVVKIFGENLDTLAKFAQEIGKLSQGVDGVQDLYVETVTGIPQLIITYHRDALARHQLNIADINRWVNLSLAGQSAGLIFEGEKRYQLVVKSKPIDQNQLEEIRNLPLPIGNGEFIPLDAVAGVNIENGPNQIQREDAKRRISVGFNIQGRDVQSIVQDLQAKVEESVDLPAGYYITYGGAFENLTRAQSRLMIAVPVALLLIFVLLYFAFHSISQALLIYTAIPLSAMGGIFMLAARDLPFSISAGVGFIALFGVAVLNGIVLVAEFNYQRKIEPDEDLATVVQHATKSRLRPVLMTAFVASLGFLPMAISTGAGAEVQRPLASVVIGGLMLATFLTLVLLPILYVKFQSISNTKNK